MQVKTETYRGLMGGEKHRVTIDVDGKTYKAKNEKKLGNRLRKAARRYRRIRTGIYAAAGASSLGGLAGAAVELGVGESFVGTVFVAGEGIAGALVLANAVIKSNIERRAERLDHVASGVYVDPNAAKLRRMAAQVAKDQKS